MTRFRTQICWAAVCLGLLLEGVSAWAQPQPYQVQPIRGRRLIQKFDFEEAKFNNYEDLPMYWFAIGRDAQTTDRNFLRQPLHNNLVNQPGFPAYTTVGFDRPQRESGEHRLHLGLNGGSVGAFVEMGALPAVPQSDYLVTAKVTTTSLQYARARILAYFVDERGRRIDDSVRSSDLNQTGGREDLLAVRLEGEYPDAAWIGLQVELLQPQQQGRQTDRHEVPYQDVKGDAWFDDVSVWQLPNVMIASQSPVNIVRWPDKPQLDLRVRDLTARPLIVDVDVYDYRMRKVDSTSRQIDEWAPATWKWQPNLEKFGWHLVDLKVREAGQGDTNSLRIARTMSSMLWLPDESLMFAEDATRFRVVADDGPDQELMLMPLLLDKSRLDSLTISAWAQDTTVSNIDERQRMLGDITQTVVGRGRELVMTLNPIPHELSQNHDIPSDDPSAIFEKPTEAWTPFLMPPLMRHGQRIHQWQLGSMDRPGLFYKPDLPSRIVGIIKTLRGMTPQPRLVLPWRLDQSRRPGVEGDVSYAIDIPTWVMSHLIGQYTDQWHDSPGTDFWLYLNEPTATEMIHDRRVQDLTLRMLHAWETEPTGIAIPRPWAFTGGRHVSLMPDPLLGVFTCVAHRLAGRRVMSRLPLGEGMRCMILNGPSRGMLAAWNESAPQDEAVVEMYLGNQPEAVDVWGNRVPVPLVGRQHRLTLTTTPTFIEGIDAPLAMLRASFKMLPAFIESLSKPHQRSIQFTNPWPMTINGHMRIVGPSKWDIQPRVHHFSLAPGQTVKIPVEVSFPITETAGAKRVVARFEFTAGSQHYDVDISAPVKLGLANVDFDATVELIVNPETGLKEDVVVTQMITNKSDEILSLYTFATLRGTPRQERIVAQLTPGQLVVRRFLFRGGGDMLKEHGVRVGVRESVGPAVLNMELSGEGH